MAYLRPSEGNGTSEVCWATTDRGGRGVFGGGILPHDFIATSILTCGLPELRDHRRNGTDGLKGREDGGEVRGHLEERMWGARRRQAAGYVAACRISPDSPVSIATALSIRICSFRILTFRSACGLARPVWNEACDRATWYWGFLRLRNCSTMTRSRILQPLRQTLARPLVRSPSCATSATTNLPPMPGPATPLCLPGFSHGDPVRVQRAQVRLRPS